MSSPYKREGHVIAMLNLLKTLSQSIAPSTAVMKELEIPLLVKYLEELTEFTWNQKTWEDRLIQFRRNSLKMPRGSRWSLRLSKELNNQIESFDSPSLEKNLLCWSWGAFPLQSPASSFLSAQPHLQRRPQRSPWQGMRSERALTCQPAALINRRKQPPLHVCCQLDFE
nr:maestro heat-like repeat-containing protein family member 2A isoform X6 [Odocoileus virginianus texanus]